MRICALVGIGLLLSVFLVPSIAAFGLDDMELDFSDRTLKSSEYTPHDRIVIQRNEDFITQGWAGSGSSEDPFCISGLEFVTDSTGIEITDTSVYFSISDCYFTAASDPLWGTGVNLTRLQNGLVENCVFEHINSGVMLEYADMCTVSGSTMDHTYIPLTLYESDDCSIRNNTIAGSILIYRSANCYIYENDQTQYPLGEDSVGLSITSSDGCVIAGNAFSEDCYGLWISCCLDTEVENNTFYHNGIVLRGPDEENFRIEEKMNSVNGRPLGYYYSVSNQVVNASEYGQIILASCQNIVIQNGLFENTTIGALLASCDGCWITGTTLKNNVYGVAFDRVTGCGLNTSSIVNNYIGVLLEDLSVDVSIVKNIISQNEQGIGFSSAGQCQVLENIIVDNTHLGLGVGGAGSHICYNTFGRNGMNAVDGGYGNSWDNGVDCGNWWDDATLGAVYVVPGEAGSVDRYPNGTAGTYTLPPTTVVKWIGNDTLNGTPLEVMVVIASSIGVVVLIGTIVYTRKGREG